MHKCEPSMKELKTIKKELEFLVQTKATDNDLNRKKLKAISCQIDRRSED